MKIKQLLTIIIFLVSQSVMANNVQVTNVRLTGLNTTDNFTFVEFDITWENSWRYAPDAGPGNWDAVWIFIKYKIGSGGNWQHAWLNDTGHTYCNNTELSNGLRSPELPYNSITNPSLGVFLNRSVPGFGTHLCQDVKLRWNYGSNNVADNAQVDLRVFAIEMVYIPQGNFNVGSGGSEAGAFYKYPSTTTPYLINSEAAITVGTTTDNLFYSNPTGESGDQSGPIPAEYPKGFNAFYAMKYEISQQGYVDFLNTLTRTQQIMHVATNVSGSGITNRWVMSNTFSADSRSYIKCRLNIPPQPGPVDFQVDKNDNNIPNEESDGQYIACGYLSYNDVSAYLDWSALRLMTEFEFEKCGRGNLEPLPNEFAWGNNVFNLHAGVNNIDKATESPNDPISNVTSNINNGPLRVGIFARENSDRTIAGAGYYGCLDLSSNLVERGVSVGSTTGRAYTGVHGDGQLSTAGNHDVPFWPDAFAAVGIFLRGGSFQNSSEVAKLSDRTLGAVEIAIRNKHYGGRGVRIAP